MEHQPPRLYKYRDFGVNSLKTLTAAEVFFARPKTFNDPLDGKLKVVPDLGWPEAEELWWRLSQEEILDAKPRPAPREVLERTLGEYRHLATQHDGHFQDGGGGTRIYLALICRSIQQRIYKELESWGVLALASRWDCPLMWSHYGAQHHGLCFEFDTSIPPPKGYDVRRVSYGLARTIPLSCIARWKSHGSVQDRQAILDAYFVAKAPDWRYEDEYRVLHQRAGIHDTPFRVKAVYFGMRCDFAVKTAIVNLTREHDGIDFYTIDAVEDGFQLRRYEHSADEERAMGGVRRSAWEYFDDLTAADGGDAPGAE